MKVLIGQFTTESNEHIPYKNDITKYDLAFGEELINKMYVRDLFEEAGIEIIPSIYAVAGPSGVIQRNTFDYIESVLLDTIRDHLQEIDGIYLMLHGASEVEGLGSGEHHLVAEIRKLVGPYLPVAVACDPHGNLCREFVESLTILRSYRESPHTDQVDTWRKVAGMLVDHLKHRQNIHPVYQKLPLILGGEQSVSTDEPVRSINQFMDQLEQDPRILSCSWHVGYIRHDTDVAGCGVVVIPATEKDQDYAREVCAQLADYVWQRHDQFHYTGNTVQPEEALRLALAHEGKPAVITDSGDNVTSGATGWNTFILRQFLAEKELKKSVLFASICDPVCCSKLSGCALGETVQIELGTGYDSMSEQVPLTVTVKKKGDVVLTAGIMATDQYKVFGQCVVVNVTGTPIDIIVASCNKPYQSDIHFEKAGLTWTDYDIVVVKLGYIFPRLKELASYHVMSLTQGATPQDTASIPFKRIQRPMFPIDQI